MSILKIKNALNQWEGIPMLKGDPGEASPDFIAKYNEAMQAMVDLLAMMGSDIATLTDGKLTPSQIPALSINDVFEAVDTDAMLLLTAQRGDVALIIPVDVVTDSYILADDDATVLANWKKLGVSYVANAGHATTADSATDSTKINGHRLVTMTESQYAVAVLEDNTLYAVYPDEV